MDVNQSQQRIEEEKKETIRDILAVDRPDVAQKVGACVFRAAEAY